MDFTTFEKIVQNTNPEEGVFARFYDRAVKTGELDDCGFPKFEMVCFVEIRLRDNNSEVFDQPATEEKIRRFPAEYARYQLAKQQVRQGTPLEQFAFLTAAEIEGLKVRGIFTIEELAKLDDDKAEQLEVKYERDLALKFMEQAKNTRALAEWQQKENQFQEQIELLKAKVESLKNSLQKAKKKKVRA